MEEIMKNITDTRNQINQYISATDQRLEILERRSNAYAYLERSKKDKALEVLDTTIMVMTGSLTVLMSIAMIMLMR